MAWLLTLSSVVVGTTMGVLLLSLAAVVLKLEMQLGLDGSKVLPPTRGGLTGGGLIRSGGEGYQKIPRDESFFIFYFLTSVSFSRVE